jgi:hypothetical protein
MKTFNAKFDGRCAGCGGAIHAGEMIAWTKQNGKGISYHIECQPGRNGEESAVLAPVDDENAAYQDYLDYREYYKDETGWLKS